MVWNCMFDVYRLLTLDICLYPCKAHHLKITTIATPRSFLVALCVCNLALLGPQATANLLSSSINCYAFSRILYKWNHAVYTVFFLIWLFSVNMIILRTILLVACAKSFFPFHWQSTLLRMYTDTLAHPKALSSNLPLLEQQSSKKFCSVSTALLECGIAHLI